MSGQLQAQTGLIRISLFAVLVLCSCALTGCKAWMINPPYDRIKASNNRDWTPEFSRLPVALIDGDTVELKNIRNCQYLTEEDFVVEYYDKTIDLNSVQSVDFIVVPFKNEALAHTMLSFKIADDDYLAISVEIRTEKGELYHPLLGLARQYEITYVMADERDLIRLRTEHRDADVYVYPTVATPAQSQLLLVDVLQRMNGLAAKPEFYNAFTNNCTTNLANHVNQISNNRIPYNWKVLLPGFSAEYAYNLGLLDNSIPFEDLKQISYVNELAARHFHEPDFSTLLRPDREQLRQRLGERARRRQAILDGPGAQFLDQPPKRPSIFR